MDNQTALNEVKEHLLNGNIVGLPIVQLQMLEEIKEYCFSFMGPLMVGVDMKHELFILGRDPTPGGEKWY